jgi:hypothetical protein
MDATDTKTLTPAMLGGRSWGTQGAVVHLVPMTARDIRDGGPVGYATALCGRQQGRRSVGWARVDLAVTCPRCRAKAE